MNKDKLKQLWNLLGVPAIMIAVGIILLVNPDSATALVCKIIGWVLVIVGAVKAISMADKRGASNPGGWVLAAVCIVVGIYFLKNPLILSNLLGRIVGILLVLEGLDDLHHRTGSRAMAIVTTAVGVILILLPRTLANTILGLCGIVLIVVGVLNLLGRIKNTQRLEDPEKPSIIDADE